jgi:hypothetical protein
MIPQLIPPNYFYYGLAMPWNVTFVPAGGVIFFAGPLYQPQGLSPN